MTRRPATATEAARRLWEIPGDGTAPEAVAAHADRVCADLRVGLERWIGAEGYRVLLDRSLVLARMEHAALRDLGCRGGEPTAIAAAVRAHGPARLRAAMVTLLGALIELLGRIIGEDMAVRIVQQTLVPAPRDAPGAETRGAQDG